MTVQVLPFVRQEEYDQLLWSCDFNAVRGEDSFVRAQWAGRPMLWHIYQQDEDIHLDKLDAFLELYTQGLSPEAKAALIDLWRAWNAGGEMAQGWKNSWNTGRKWPLTPKSGVWNRARSPILPRRWCSFT